MQGYNLSFKYCIHGLNVTWCELLAWRQIGFSSWFFLFLLLLLQKSRTNTSQCTALLCPQGLSNIPLSPPVIQHVYRAIEAYPPGHAHQGHGLPLVHQLNSKEGAQLRRGSERHLRWLQDLVLVSLHHRAAVQPRRNQLTPLNSSLV